MIQTTKLSAFSTPIQINSLRTNTSYTHFFFKDDKKDDQIKYCKICIKEYEGTCMKLYSYFKSGSSTRYLTHHLYDKHNIIANNYKEHLDSSQEVCNLYRIFKAPTKINLISQSIKFYITYIFF